MAAPVIDPRVLSKFIPNAVEASTVTLASGVFAPTRASHVIAAETGVTDDLTTVTMTDLNPGDTLKIWADVGDTITIKHGAGNVTCRSGSDIEMTGDVQFVEFHVSADGSGVIATTPSTEDIGTDQIANDAVDFDKLLNAVSAGFIGATAAGNYGHRTYAQTKSDLELVVGTNISAWSAKTDALAAQTWAADQLTYQTSSSAVGVTALTAYARTLLDDADAAAARTTLGLGALAVLNTVGSATIDANSVLFANFQLSSTTQVLVGRATAGAGNFEQVTLSVVLDWLNSTQGAIFTRTATGWEGLAPGTSGHFLKSNGAGANLSYAAGGTGDALVANPLSQFAATTSAQLAGVISDETGSGALVFGTAPTIAGGSITALTTFGLRDTSAAFDVTVAAVSSAALTAGRTLTLDMGNVAHTLAFGTTANTITFPNVASDTVVMLGATQTLTAKTLTAPDINAGTVDSLTSLSVRDTSAAFDLTLAAVSSTALTAGRTLTIDVINAARTIKLAGNIDIAGSFATSGAFGLTCTLTATTSVTFPTTGTLATLAGTETFTGKTLTSPTINGGTIQSRVQTSSETGGSLTTASANKAVNLATAPTIATSTFTAGDTIILYNNTGSAMTVTASGGTQRLHGSATTGNLTLALRGVASAYFVSATEWVLSGDVS